MAYFLPFNDGGIMTKLAILGALLLVTGFWVAIGYGIHHALS
jgi:hypothetical protein